MIRRERAIVFAGIITVVISVVILSGNLKWRAAALYLGLPQPTDSIVVERDVMVPMSDRIKLAADLYRPRKPGRYPVIVTRTPYGKQNPHHKYALAGGLFASHGFVYLVQDVRGKYNSEGEFYPYVNEGKDGHETFEWSGKQPWSNGNVGAYGFSYFGSTQWLSAPYQSNYLRAMVPIVTSQDLYPRWIYNGIFRYNDVLFWHYGNFCKTERKLEDIDADKAIWGLPPLEADDEMFGDLPSYNDWINHPVPDEYWDRLRVDDKVDRIMAPALMIGGWYDYYLESMFDDFNRMGAASGSADARQSRLIIGPWTHETVSKFTDVDFGPQADFMLQIKRILEWYDYWLKNEQNDALKSAPITLFVMGRNEWRGENEWPLARTQFIKYYLHSGGRANTAGGDGLLDVTPPKAEAHDQFVYDPDKPVPSIGGTSIYGKATPGPRDQNEVEKRPDVLVYTTPPLSDEVEVTGPVKVFLYASSSARDTDFSAKLVDLYPDGKAINLRSGMVRARYRESFEHPSFLEQGMIYEFQIPVGATSNLFKKAHRIRLEISSSHFPEFGRNLNTEGDTATSSSPLKASQTIFHDKDHPSCVLLPIVPID